MKSRTELINQLIELASYVREYQDAAYHARVAHATMTRPGIDVAQEALCTAESNLEYAIKQTEKYKNVL